MLTPLEAQQAALTDVQTSDFRADNLYRMVGARLGPGRTLDVGCGGGGMVSWLLDQGEDAWGIDQSPHTVEAAKGHLTRRGHDPARVSNDDLRDWLDRGELVDNVISMDCLEHVADDRGLMANMVAITRPGGRLVITVPALMAVYGPRDEAIGHHRRYHKGDLERLLADLPVEVEDLRYWNLLGVPPAFLYARILKAPLQEGFRYGEPTLAKRALRKGLHLWFAQVERRLRPPVGLTLILTCRRLP